MVYNEGFDILVEDYSFFAFSKYAMNDNSKSDVSSRWVSKCQSTLVGWYHKGNKYGCFFADKFTTKIKLSSSFKDHEQVVKRLNSMGNLWKAANYDQYKDMTIEDLNNFAGRNRNKHQSKIEEFRFKSTSTSIKSDKVKKDLSLLKKLSNYHLNHKKTFLKTPPQPLAQSDSSYPDMPREHTQWIKYMSEPRNQVYIF